MLKSELLVLSANCYQMTNKDTGEYTEGCGVRFLTTTDLVPKEEDNLKGYRVGKSKLPYDDFEKFGDIPGIYEADLDINIASDGTVKVNAENFVFKRPFVQVPEKKKEV